MELTLDFKSHAGRPTLQSRFVDVSAGKRRLVRLAATLLGRAAGKESILPAAITTRCRSMVLLGAGTVVGVKGRPPFTRHMAVWHHLKRLQGGAAAPEAEACPGADVQRIGRGPYALMHKFMYRVLWKKLQV